jgi:hypothetical protein
MERLVMSTQRQVKTKTIHDKAPTASAEPCLCYPNAKDMTNISAIFASEYQPRQWATDLDPEFAMKNIYHPAGGQPNIRCLFFFGSC